MYTMSAHDSTSAMRAFNDAPDYDMMQPERLALDRNDMRLAFRAIHAMTEQKRIFATRWEKSMKRRGRRFYNARNERIHGRDVHATSKSTR